MKTTVNKGKEKKPQKTYTTEYVRKHNGVYISSKGAIVVTTGCPENRCSLYIGDCVELVSRGTLEANSFTSYDQPITVTFGND